MDPSPPGRMGGMGGMTATGAVRFEQGASLHRPTNVGVFEIATIRAGCNFTQLHFTNLVGYVKQKTK